MFLPEMYTWEPVILALLMSSSAVSVRLHECQESKYIDKLKHGNIQNAMQVNFKVKVPKF